MAFRDIFDRYVAMTFSILVVGLMAVDKQQYPQWSNILQDIEGSSLRHSLTHAVEIWPDGIMKNYSNLEVSTLERKGNCCC